ncbi:VOC family protein [Enterococcus faecium]
MFLSLKTLYRKRTVIWPFYFYTIIRTLSKEIYDSQQKKFSLYPEKFFLVKDLWIAVMQNSSNKLPKTYNHIAFKIDEQDIDSFVSKIQMLGLTVEPGRSRVKDEASSIYFYDYDNHLFELHTGTLQERLKSYNSTT